MADGGQTLTESMRIGSEAEIETGRRLFAGSCDFVRGVVTIADLPPPDLPEIVFAGRSNVGKSSLINAVTGRKTLARVSNTPGRTRQLNFFNLTGRLMLVDLPGYGYAAIAKRESAKWPALIRRYLKGRPNLMRLCLLIDSRHGITGNDSTFMRELDEAALSYQLVLTKIDKLARHEQAEIQTIVSHQAARHPAAHPEILATSAETGTGIPELRAALSEFALAESRPTGNDEDL